MRRHALSLLVLGLLVLLALGSVDSKKSSPSPSPSPPSQFPARTEADLDRLRDAASRAHAVVDSMLRVSQLDFDIKVNHECFFVRGIGQVNVELVLISSDGVSAYRNGTLKRQLYPTLKATYLTSLRAAGFTDASVSVYTDVAK